MTMPTPSVRIGSRLLLLGAPVIAIAALASGSWFRVRQNEVAYVIRFGQVVNAQVRCSRACISSCRWPTKQIRFPSPRTQ